MKRRVMIYRRFERFWHWTQALLVILLALTGFEIHFAWWSLLGWQMAVELHGIFAWSFVVLIGIAIFWHLTTGEWRHYLPTRRGLVAMARYYAYDIFFGRPHPVKKTQLRKLNPLQALTYLALKVLVIPVVVTSGFLYYFFNDWSAIGIGDWRLEPVALVHTFAAFLMIAFLFLHAYLTTTGHTPLSNIRAMINGWEEIEIVQE
jgi:thiosulfate reductase cytochrome b subunit